ncbi:hypothetical protein [Staphylococcus epidermidis]|nr:hypothetical protein [Staphylococcus epidermidis]
MKSNVTVVDEGKDDLEGTNDEELMDVEYSESEVEFDGLLE